jgi:hypothetical protein
MGGANEQLAGNNEQWGAKRGEGETAGPDSPGIWCGFCIQRLRNRQDGLFYHGSGKVGITGAWGRGQGNSTCFQILEKGLSKIEEILTSRSNKSNKFLGQHPLFFFLFRLRGGNFSEISRILMDFKVEKVNAAAREGGKRLVAAVFFLLLVCFTRYI